jgi:hypothetical protein
MYQLHLNLSLRLHINLKVQGAFNDADMFVADGSTTPWTSAV